MQAAETLSDLDDDVLAPIGNLHMPLDMLADTDPSSSSSSSRDDQGSDGGTIWTSTHELPVKPAPAEAAEAGPQPAFDGAGGLAPEVAEAAVAASEGCRDPMPEPAAAAAAVAAVPAGVPARRGLQHTVSLDHYLQVGLPAQARTHIA